MRGGAGGYLGYGVAARIFHWLAVLLIFVTIPVGFLMTQGLPRSVQDPMFALHKTIGVTLLILMLARLAWRIGHGAPPPAPMPRTQQIAAATVHWTLYVLVIAMAVTGYTRVAAGGFPIEILNALGVPPLLAKNEVLASAAKSAHASIAIVLIVVIAGHVAAAAYHALVRKDRVASRIWPPFSA